MNKQVAADIAEGLNTQNKRKADSEIYFINSIHYCELCIESRDNLYIARFWSNGDFEYAHNCRKVDALPCSPLAVRLVAAVSKYRDSIRRYMATDDVATKRELFWSIKKSLQERINL
jgi:hypothetical protein